MGDDFKRLTKAFMTLWSTTNSIIIGEWNDIVLNFELEDIPDQIKYSDEFVKEYFLCELDNDEVINYLYNYDVYHKENKSNKSIIGLMNMIPKHLTKFFIMYTSEYIQNNIEYKTLFLNSFKPILIKNMVTKNYNLGNQFIVDVLDYDEYIENEEDCIFNIDFFIKLKEYGFNIGDLLYRFLYQTHSNCFNTEYNKLEHILNTLTK